MGKYNKAWLRTEYDTAVRSARMASQWQDMERTADRFPNVEYLRTRSATPREDHLEYVGIIRPLTDAFWDTHTPPLGWNCKCGIKSTDARPTAIPSGLPEVPPGLRNNPARSGSPFSEDHPYAKNAHAVEERLRKEFRQQITRMGLYYQVKTPGGQIVLLHPGVDKKELRPNLAAAVKLTDTLGLKVRVRPRQIGAGKQPDFEINGEQGDLKTMANPSNPSGAIQTQIKSAAKQKAHYAILDISGFQPTESQIEIGLQAALQEGRNKSVQEVILINGNDVKIIERKALNHK